MNTKFAGFFILLSLPFLSIGQLHIGLSGGPVLGNFTVFSSVQSEPRGIETTVNSQVGTGFSFQIPMQYSFSRFIAIQPEIGYQRQIAGIQRNYSMPGQEMNHLSHTETYQMNQFQGSVLLKAGTGGSRFQIYAIGGPTLSVFAGGNKETREVATFQTGESEDYWSANPIDATSENLTKNIYSLTAGLGINIMLPHYVVFVEGRQSFSNKNNINSETESLKFKSRVVQLGVLFRI